ncbi:hypothetical protein [Halosimplex pelagicum]|uniref:Uncharacterized protein n=1 Tax=Halosimplex pelagicum TaxID=869886 RepID=A0A7D5TWF8_9EURY|nr:hypothetical protein [Halosimplex pelagicum]QLH84034.1 hypothetical protein HZS54_21390 [Halosimplex pelagicum]
MTADEAERPADDGRSTDDGRPADDERPVTDTRPDSDAERSTESTDGTHPVVRAAALSVRLLWFATRLAVAGGIVAAKLVADPERRARFRRWLLLSGDRWRIAALMVGAVGLGTFLLSLAGVVGVAEGSFVATAFGAVISGLFSFVPIVVAVNQLTVARLFGSPEQVREQVDDVAAFRREFERDHPEVSVSPTEPAPFLGVAVEVVAGQADALADAVDSLEGRPRAAVDAYVGVVRAQVADVRAHLDGSHQPLIEILPPMMGDSYSRNVNDARRIRERYADELPGAAREGLAELEESFVALDVLRQYFKALYLTQELSYLSRFIGYTGVGAFLVATMVIMAFANGQPLGGHPILLDGLLSLAFAAVFVPFAVLLSFLLRVATIAKRTAAPGTFTPYRETPDYATHRDGSDPFGRN